MSHNITERTYPFRGVSKSQRREQKGSPARTADEISDDNVAFEIVLKHEIFADVKESSTIRLKAFQEELTGRCKLCSLLVDESVHSNALVSTVIASQSSCTKRRGLTTLVGNKSRKGL